MLKKWQKTTACLLAAAMASVTVGCDSTPVYSTPDAPVEEKDELRTQLYIYNTDFVGGGEWLQRLADEFELLHAEDSEWEDGKTGVQVIVRASTNRDEDLTARLKTGVEEVYFSQTPSYRAVAEQNLLLDLTELVTAELPNEARSIADKLSEEQKEYYGVQGEEEPFEATYYGIPYRSGTFGLVYNVDLFEKYGYYFAAESTSELDPFVKTATERRSAGADGEWNTFDDGLPATYAEFFTLCDKISSNGHVPVTWGGATYGEYLTWLTNALATDCDGYEQTKLRYTLDGEAKGLGSIRNGGFAAEEKATQITEENGYELVRSTGVYRALEFVRKLTTTERYYDGEAFRTNRTQDAAQLDFMAGERLTGTPMKKPIAMLADGSWWQSGMIPSAEAEAESESVETAEAVEAEEETRFGFMPLPKATKSQVGERTTLYNSLCSSVFVSARTEEWKRPLVEEFLRFIYSDDGLKEYMLLTNGTVALDVSLDETESEELSYFGKSVAKILMNADMVAPYSTNSLFLKNESEFSAQSFWGASFALATPIQHPAEAFRKNNVSVVDYFNGMFKNRSEKWGQLKKN